MKLTESEKSQLIAEEIFRNEVRESLSKKQRNKFLDFLQTPLGNIITSTVIIGSVTALWGFLANVCAERKAKTELVLKLDREIEYRFIQLNQQQRYFAKQDSINEKPCEEYSDSWTQWRNKVLEFKNSPNKTLFLCAHQEFYDVNTFALMMRIADLSEVEQQNEIRKSAFDLAINNYLPATGEVTNCKVYRKFISDFRLKIWLPRWKQSLVVLSAKK